MSYHIWIEKSQENLTVAEWCFENDHLNACANRMYYAMFHAASAILSENGITPSKGKIGHDWLQANFAKYFINRRKSFPSRFRSYLADAQKIRDNADYRDYPVGKKFVSRELKKDRDFVQTIHSEILS